VAAVIHCVIDDILLQLILQK